ncbi:MAG TPA: hypothetical protein DDZ05_01945 [Candidatus Blackburnbacteria bacterium]|nr:hypothetical protein [Candidatus Blackburnbacteria bacterium]
MAAQQHIEDTSSLTNEPEKVVFSWTVPARPFKKRDREFFTTVLAIAFLVGLILFFLDGPLPLLVIIALVFLVYVLSTVPPEEVEHSITNKGIIAAGQRHDWFNLRRFWFTNRFGAHLLVVESRGFPGRIETVVLEKDEEKIKKELTSHLPFEEVAPSFLDKSAAWLSKRIPFES